MTIVRFIPTYEYSPNDSKMWLSDPDFTCKKVSGEIYVVEYDVKQCKIDAGGKQILGKISSYQQYVGIMKHKRTIAQYDTNSFAGGKFVVYEDMTAELISFFSGLPGFSSLCGKIEHM